MVSHPQDNPTKHNLWLIIVSRTNNSHRVAFYLLPYFMPLSQFQSTDPIRHTAYIYSHMHKLRYISVTTVCFIHFVSVLTVDTLHSSIDILQLDVIVVV